MSAVSLKVHPVPAFEDNYVWVLHDGGHAAVVDPGDAAPVLAFLRANNLQLDAIICTHHHGDHVGGVDALLDQLHLRGKIPVYGPAGEDIPSCTHALKEGDQIAIESLGLAFTVIDVPGHTAGHIAYYGGDMLFCGDTLFACGCGRLFEGTAEQMQHSLAKLAALPPHTRMYCAHEYTMGNIAFAEAVEPDNGDLKLRKAFCAAKRHRKEPTLPSTIGLELATNPFLRWGVPSVQEAARSRGVPLGAPAHLVFAAIREWKNNF